jgi:aldose 1-epimerase
MRAAVQLVAGPLTADIRPSLGGGVARFDVLREEKRVEVFRGCPEGETDDPGKLGLYVLVPWSNRISGTGFTFGGVFHSLTPNIADEPCPIHGDGWLASWRVSHNDGRRLRLEHEAHALGPYRYDATLDYTLETNAMTIRLTATNRATLVLPFGLGFHPWLPRTPGTRLQVDAESVWLEDARHLPVKRVPVKSCPDWDFSSSRSLPAGWINNAFTGWNGRATIIWEDRGLTLDLEARSPLSTFILYSPSADAPFFCFEPVSHVVDAHNLSPGPEAHGLVVLVPGATLAAECRFRVH